MLDGKNHEKGVGFLHLKEATEGKHQLVIRQDTSLGTILLNIVLSNMPKTVKQDKFVRLSCVPNPSIAGFEDGKV